jgi:hypothetical protein
MSDNRSRNCILISSINCKVTGDKKLSLQNALSLPFCFASFHPSKALRSAMWSLHQKRVQKFGISDRIKDIFEKLSRCKGEAEWLSLITNLQESPAKDLFAASASSFLFSGRTKGLRCARAVAIVKAGLRH